MAMYFVLLYNSAAQFNTATNSSLQNACKINTSLKGFKTKH